MEKKIKFCLLKLDQIACCQQTANFSSNFIVKLQQKFLSIHKLLSGGEIMPHFVLDCSESVLEIHTEEYIIEQVHIAANSTKLFDERDIKVRLNPFNMYLTGNKKEDFIHVFADIMEGRTIAQKADLSKKIVQRLSSMFPQISKIAMNVREFEKATYFNRDML